LSRALVTGATGQDGHYLTKHLLACGYEVHGIARRVTADRNLNPRVIWHEADMTDSATLSRIVSEVKPLEVYNLAAQSHVGHSFDAPQMTFQVNALGPLCLLEAVRQSCPSARFYQASTSELFGNSTPPQSETTPFYPRSPYGVSKLAAYWSVVNYREAYGLHASNGILFNHESPKRGIEFVTRKITRAVAEFAHGRTEPLRLGNLAARRDWGFAGDYVKAMWLCLQEDKPGDYVIASGESHTVREFCEMAFGAIGIDIEWRGNGEAEVGVWRPNEHLYDVYRTLVVIDPKFYRPAEVNHLEGDSSKARATLRWFPTMTFRGLVAEMVAADLEAVRSNGNKAVRAA
jgi:GDPmannose 4,6-dehydratase